MCKCKECEESREAFLSAFAAMESFIKKSPGVLLCDGYTEFRDAMSVAIKVFHKKEKDIALVNTALAEYSLRDKLNEIIVNLNQLREKVDSGKMQ